MLRVQGSIPTRLTNVAGELTEVTAPWVLNDAVFQPCQSDTQCILLLFEDEVIVDLEDN